MFPSPPASSRACFPSGTSSVDTVDSVDSGKSATTNLFSSPAGDIGSGANATEADYRNFTLCFPTIKFPGSYTFSIVFNNGISDIRYSDQYNLTEENYFTENVSVLLPGGPGYVHAKIANIVYCEVE